MKSNSIPDHLRLVDQAISDEKSGSGQQLPGGHYPELLAEKPFEALVVCVNFKIFPCWRRQGIILTFRIVEPTRFEGKLVAMYAPWRKKWIKGPPPSSKIAKAAVIATGCRRNRYINRATFVGKVYRVRIRPTSGDVPYSVVDKLYEKLAGGGS